MLDSWFSQLAFSAAAVTALALVVLLRARDHAHKAAPGGAARWVRAVEAAALVGIGGFGVAALLGAGPGPAALVGGLLGGSVLGWAQVRRSWRVAAVTTWSSGTVAAASWLVWLVEGVVSAASLGPALLLLALTPLVLWGLVSLREPAQAWLASRGGAPVAAPAAAGYGRRTLLALAAAVAPALAAVAVVSSVQAPPSPRAGSVDTGSASQGGSPGPGAPGGTSSTSAPAEVPGPTAVSPTDDETAPDTRSTPGSAAPTSSPIAGATGSADSTTPTAPVPSGTPTGTAPIVSPTTPETTKTPGYEKEKPNRPTDAPSPGGGRPR